METVRLLADPYPPYQFRDGPAIRGVDHDLIAAAFGEVGLGTRTRLLPWEECLRLLEAGEAEGVFQITPTAEREKTYLFSEPLRTARTVLFLQTKKPVSLTPPGDLAATLKGKRLGTVRGYNYDPLIDGLKESARLLAASQEELLGWLGEGKVDLALMDLGVAAYLAGQMGMKNIRMIEGYEIARPLHVAFIKNRPELVEQFNRGLARVKAAGVPDRVLREYGLAGG
ncbi:MAG: transporter substrate-binding domain-containing protein [Deltaproteobacteria bacterium]|nr:transporter substrate-binding domain-containing protein [Deltaproteobacteria bacterium]